MAPVPRCCLQLLARQSESPQNAPCPAPLPIVGVGPSPPPCLSFPPQNESGGVQPAALFRARVAVWVLTPWWDQDPLLLGAAHPPTVSSGSDLNQGAARECEEEEEEEGSVPHPSPRVLFLWEQGCSLAALVPFGGGCWPSKCRTMSKYAAVIWGLSVPQFPQLPVLCRRRLIPESHHPAGFRGRALLEAPVSFLPGSWLRPALSYRHRAPQGPCMFHRGPLRTLPLNTPVVRVAGVAMPSYTGPLRRCHRLAIPLSDVFYYPKMDLELIFLTCFKHLYKSPGPAAAGFSCRAARGRRRLLCLGPGVDFFWRAKGFSQRWLWVRCATVVLAPHALAAASHPPP